MESTGASTTQEQLHSRYGGPLVAPRTAKILIALLAALFLLGVGWVGIRFADVDVRAETISYEHLSSDRISVTFQVTMRPGSTAVCQVQAMNDGRAQVGFVEVPIPAQESAQSLHSVEISTQGSAVSGSVLGCERA